VGTVATGEQRSAGLEDADCSQIMMHEHTAPYAAHLTDTLTRIHTPSLDHPGPPLGSYWTWSEEGSSTWAAHPAPLPSDSRHRSDLAALAAGDRGAAAAQKTRLEQQQRADRKLREAAGVFEHQ
jgi:hypothetical protein